MMPSSQVDIPNNEHLHSTATDNAGKKKTVLEGHGYVLGHTIGTGTYATVKVAWSTTHSSNVAVKIVSKFTAPSDYLKKFLPREIEVVKGLKHPNLIRFLQAIETTHRVYIIMEYAENGSLLDIIRQDTYIDEIRAKKWFKQLLDAVHYCHERNVVHRDIKCENMLMDSHYNLKLSDFGFARGQIRTSGGQYIYSETFCGSYAYASPEILKGIPYQPHQADAWSCGVVLYAMVFGRLPFDDSNFTTLLKQVSNKVSFPREPKVSTQCKNLIQRILAPLKQRLTITAMLNEPWCVIPDMILQRENMDTPSTSRPTYSETLGRYESQTTFKTNKTQNEKSPNNVTEKYTHRNIEHLHDRIRKKKNKILEEYGYLAGRTIGYGGFAVVKEAWSSTDKCEVAIKIVSKKKETAEYIEKFLKRELDIVKGLKHPNVVTFLMGIETTHRVYIIMDYAGNGNLAEIIQENIYIDEFIAKKWFKQLIDAVNYCHERDIVHRDIKCENILMDSNYNVKLSDFGFGRKDIRTPDGHYIYSETYCGSYAYASPEILKGIPYQPHLSDAWSCGVVLYAMVFGRLPFDNSHLSILIKLVSEKVIFPQVPNISSECKRLIYKILAPLNRRLTVPKILKHRWFAVLNKI